MRVSRAKKLCHRKQPARKVYTPGVFVSDSENLSPNECDPDINMNSSSPQDLNVGEPSHVQKH